jgi:hypothetical protein
MAPARSRAEASSGEAANCRAALKFSISMTTITVLGSSPSPVGSGYHEAVSAPDRVEFRVAEHRVPPVDAGDSLFDKHDSGHEDLLWRFVYSRRHRSA